MATGLTDLHAEALRGFGDRVAAVRPRAWGRPTPCTEWSVRDVVDHTVAENLWVPDLLAGRTVDEVGDRYEGDVLGLDPLGAYRDSARRAAEAAARPGVLEATVHCSFGDLTGAVYLAQRLFDLVVHAWDLAAGAGLDRRLDEGLVSMLFPLVDAWMPRWQGSGIFAAPVPVAEGVPLQDRLLALTGRDPRFGESDGAATR